MKNILVLFFLFAIPITGRAYISKALVADGWWGEADYLLVWRKERSYPPLITTGPLFAEGTEILYGDHKYSRGPQSGGFFDAGVWMTNCLGFGGSLMLIGSEKLKYKANNPPETSLFRPFFDPILGVEATFPVDGTMQEVHFEATNNFWIIDGYLCWSVIDCPCWEFAFLAGFGYSVLADSFEVKERIIPSVIGLTQVLSHDRFDCKNNYYAGVFGFVSDWTSASWGLHFWGKLYFGNMVRNLNISGERENYLPSGSFFIEQGDLFSQLNNIGTHCKHGFEVVPMTGINLRLQLCRCIAAQVGYFYTFFPRIFLAGEQIDLNIDLAQAADGSSIYPQVTKHETSFWLQGVSIGLLLNF